MVSDRRRATRAVVVVTAWVLIIGWVSVEVVRPWFSSNWVGGILFTVFTVAVIVGPVAAV